jgi:hypothetical protein
MATYDQSDGTGGLDASVQLPEEQSRPEVGIFYDWSSSQYFLVTTECRRRNQ